MTRPITHVETNAQLRTRPIVEGLIDTPLARAQEVHRLYGLERAYERSQAIPMPELTIS